MSIISWKDGWELDSSQVMVIRFNCIKVSKVINVVLILGLQWQTRRKILTPAFHFSVLKNYVNVFNKESVHLTKILEKEVGNTIDIIPVVTQFTMRSIAGSIRLFTYIYVLSFVNVSIIFVKQCTQNLWLIYFFFHRGLIDIRDPITHYVTTFSFPLNTCITI